MALLTIIGKIYSTHWEWQQPIPHHTPTHWQSLQQTPLTSVSRMISYRNIINRIFFKMLWAYGRGLIRFLFVGARIWSKYGKQITSGNRQRCAWSLVFLWQSRPIIISRERKSQKFWPGTWSRSSCHHISHRKCLCILTTDKNQIRCWSNKHTILAALY